MRIADQHSNGLTRKDIKGVIELVLRFGSRQFCHARAKACFGRIEVETDEAEGAANSMHHPSSSPTAVYRPTWI